MCWINSTEMGFHLSIFQPRACAQDSWEEGLAFGQSQQLSLLPHLPKYWALLSIQLSDLRLDLTTALESLQQVTWQSDYSVTQIYFLNKDPAATNYTSFPLTYKAARKLAPGTSCLRSPSPLYKTSSLQVVHELSQQTMGPEAKDRVLLEWHVLNTFIRILCQKTPWRTTGKTLPSLNRTNPSLFSGMRYTGYETASPTSSSWDPLRPHQIHRTFAPPPKAGCSTPQGTKSQLPHEPKAFVWKRRRRKAKWFFRVLAEDS